MINNNLLWSVMCSAHLKSNDIILINFLVYSRKINVCKSQNIFNKLPVPLQWIIGIHSQSIWLIFYFREIAFFSLSLVKFIISLLFKWRRRVPPVIYACMRLVIRDNDSSAFCIGIMIYCVTAHPSHSCQNFWSLSPLSTADFLILDI